MGLAFDDLHAPSVGGVLTTFDDVVAGAAVHPDRIDMVLSLVEEDLQARGSEGPSSRLEAVRAGMLLGNPSAILANLDVSRPHPEVLFPRVPIAVVYGGIPCPRVLDNGQRSGDGAVECQAEERALGPEA